MWMHKTYLKDHCTYSGKWTLNIKALYSRWSLCTQSFFHLAVMVTNSSVPCNLRLPSPLIPLVHSFHKSFSSFRFIPWLLRRVAQKDVWKEQLYWVSIGWWFGDADVSFYIQIPRRFWNSVNEDYKPESHGK